MGLKTMQKSSTDMQSCNRRRERSSQSSPHPKLDFLTCLWLDTQSGRYSQMTHAELDLGKREVDPHLI